MRAEAKASVRTSISHPVGRTAQAVVCKTTQASATLARDSNFPGISVERHALMATWPDTRFSALGILLSAMRNPGVDQNFTDLAAVVQIRLRVAVFADGSRVANFDSEVPALNRRELGANPRQPTISASVVKFIIILRFERRVCRWESCRMHQFMPR